MMRAARRDELDLVMDWAADEGWNPELDDASAFCRADPDGFFVTEHDGHPVAAISVVNHSDTFAFLGLYLCLPAWRGQGIGHALWQHARARAGTRSVGLDGVAAQHANYAKSGFVHAGATLRIAGALAAQDAPDIRPARPTDDLAALDRAAFGYARARFLSAMTRDTATRRTLVFEPGASAATWRSAQWSSD